MKLHFMPTHPLISVIVPVFNAEPFLMKCLESLMDQSYSNLEILLINDGSQDNSGKICEDYANQDKRLKVFHQDNRGVSSARNVGLENATGDWLCFVDSDDYLDLDGIEHLVNLTNKYQQVDLIRSYHKVVDKLNKQTINQTHKDGALYSPDELLKSNKIGGFISSLFVKRKIVTDNNLRFSTELKIKEDMVFTFQCVLECKWILENRKPFYNRLVHDASATKTINYEKVKNSLKASETVYEYSLNYDNYVVKESVNRYLNNGLQEFIYGISRLSVQDKTITVKEVRKTILNYLNKCHLSIHELNNRNIIYTIIPLVDFRVFALIRKIVINRIKRTSPLSPAHAPVL